MKIALLMTGDEIMGGDMVDTNSSFLCGEFSELGLRVGKIVTVGDEPEKIIKEIKVLAEEHSVLIINGGLGPTVDDYTSESIAKAFDDELVENPEALKQLKNWLKQKGYFLNQANLKQAVLPKKAEPIINSKGSAPGIFYTVGNCRIFATPGVPSEMSAMWFDFIRVKIREIFSVSKTRTDVLRTFGIGESTIQDGIKQNLTLPPHIELGFRAYSSYVDIKLTYPEKHMEEAGHYGANIKKIFSDYVLSHDTSEISDTLSSYLKKKKAKLAIAESCTGGNVSSMMTRKSGASEFFLAGLVVYDSKFKREILDVSPEILREHGPVSKECAEQMLKNLFELTGADYGISITGLAGPEGDGSRAEVGSVFIGFGSKNGNQVRKLSIVTERQRFITAASMAAIDLLRRHILNLKTDCPYSFDRLNPYKL